MSRRKPPYLDPPKPAPRCPKPECIRPVEYYTDSRGMPTNTGLCRECHERMCYLENRYSHHR